MSQGSTKGVPIDPDANMAADLDTLVASQKATKARIEARLAAYAQPIATASNGVKKTGVDFQLDVSTLTEDTTPDPSDFVPTYDTSAAAHKRVKLSNLFREALLANRTYYVRTDGSDSNTGLVNSSGGAFLTIQKAVNVVCGTLDIGNFTVTIQVGAGTYTAGVSLFVYVAGTGSVTITGDTATPSNVVISVSTAGSTSGRCFWGRQYAGLWTIEGFKVTTTGSGTEGIRCDGGTKIVVNEFEFGACVTAHVLSTQVGGSVQLSANYSITGNAARHILIQAQSSVGYVSGITVTLTGTPAFSSAFIQVTDLSFGNGAGVTFSGGATGQRYNGQRLGNINTAGGGANYFPGNSAGSVATGAQYN